MHNSRYYGFLIAGLFLIICAAQTKTQPTSWNDISRVAAVESLVERGTWVIDDSPWAGQTLDKVFVDGKYYSDKMPLLSLMGAAVYGVLHRVVGASLALGCTAPQVCAYYWVTLILIGIPAALLLWLFFEYARFRQVPLWAALVGSIALGAGTMVLPYALVFNHHLPAAVSLFAAFYLLATRAESDRWRLTMAGLLAGLAIAFDPTAGILAAALFGIALLRGRIRSVYFLLGAALPVVITAGLDLWMVRTPLPPYLIPDAYNFPGSIFPATVGGNGTPDDYYAYAFRMFVGGQGLFAYNPLLLLALVGALIVAWKRHHPLWIQGLMIAGGFLLLAFYLATQTGNYGGVAYGERYFVPAIPILFAFIFAVPPLNGVTWRNTAWVFFGVLLGLSVYSSFQGAQGPWLYSPPPFHLVHKKGMLVAGYRWNVVFP